MVRIIGKTKEEIDMEDRCSRLKELARTGLSKLISPIKISGGGAAFRVELNKPTETIDIYPLGNRIDVSSPRALDYAMKLAEIYEKAGEPEFTVKRDYRE